MNRFATPNYDSSWGRIDTNNTIVEPLPIAHVPAAISPQIGNQNFVGYDSNQKLFRSQSEGNISLPSKMSRNSQRNQRRENRDISIPVTFTPATNRISKAMKGKRVHKCEFEGCVKVFTRAEHRRRHEQNHKLEATYTCPIEGCNRGFHRLDLLSRHTEKHNNPHSRPSRSTISTHRRLTSRGSVAAAKSPILSPPASIEQRSNPASTSIQPPVTPPLHSQPTVASTYANNLSPPMWNGVRRSSEPLTGYSPLSYVPENEPSIFSSPDCSRSPSSDGSSFHFQTPTIAGIETFQETLIDTTLMTTPLPYGQSFSEFNPFDSCSMQTSQLALSYENDSIRPVVRLPLSELDGDEWITLQREFTSVIGSLSAFSGLGVDLLRWQECLEYYWQYFHPLFPIVHKPSFIATKPNPLMVGAMVAIGSQFDKRQDVSVYSLGLLDVCQKLLSKKGKIQSRSVVSDIQAVVLLEILAKYRSRRADISISHSVRSLYGSFAQTQHIVLQNPLGLLHSTTQNTSDGIQQAHKFWVERETRRRLLQALFVLDVNQSILFRQKSAFQQTTGMDHTSKYRKAGSLDLPFPCNHDLWECEDVTLWATHAAQITESLTLEAACNKVTSSTGMDASDLDPFQSNLVLSYIMIGPDNKVEELMRPIIEKADSDNGQSASLSYMRFLYHAFLAARYSPLKSLITVSNESWLFNRKVSNIDQFHADKRTLRAWTSDTEAVKKSVWHAVRVLQYTLATPEQSSFFCAAESSSSGQIPAHALIYSSEYFDSDLIPLNPFGTNMVDANVSVSGLFHEPTPLPAFASAQPKPPPYNDHQGPLIMLQANWAIYVCALICWAYGVGTAPKQTPNTSSTPLPSMTSAQLYISSLITLAPSWSYITSQNIPTHISRDTDALLRHVCLVIIQAGVTGGLLSEGERVLQRLLEHSANPHQKGTLEF